MRNLDEIPLVEQYLLALQGFRDGITNPDTDPEVGGPYGGGCSGEWTCWIGGFLASVINRDVVELGMRAFRSGLPRSLNAPSGAMAGDSLGLRQKPQHKNDDQVAAVRQGHAAGGCCNMIKRTAESATEPLTVGKVHEQKRFG
jgi:hypothetical protein